MDQLTETLRQREQNIFNNNLSNIQTIINYVFSCQ